MKAKSSLSVLLYSSILILLAGCGSRYVRTQAEIFAGNYYIPLDPSSVDIEDPDIRKEFQNTDPETKKDLLRYLPDNTVRNLVETYDAEGNLSLNISTTKVKSGTRRIIVDYINTDIVTETFYLRKQMKKLVKNGHPSEEDSFVNPFLTNLQNWFIGSETYEVKSDLDPQTDSLDPSRDDKWHEIKIPLHIGIGLRATATIYDYSGKTEFTSIGNIGGSAESRGVKGTLVLQTIGINGKQITDLIPVQTELNRTTVQTAIGAITSIKPLIANGETYTLPRVVGMRIPFNPDTKLINVLSAAIACKKITWHPTKFDPIAPPADGNPPADGR